MSIRDTTFSLGVLGGEITNLGLHVEGSMPGGEEERRKLILQLGTSFVELVQPAYRSVVPGIEAADIEMWSSATHRMDGIIYKVQWYSKFRSPYTLEYVEPRLVRAMRTILELKVMDLHLRWQEGALRAAS